MGSFAIRATASNVGSYLNNGRQGPVGSTVLCQIATSPTCCGRDVSFNSRPPHRTVRAAFPHTAPTSGVTAKRSLGQG